jgi:hypothetical protein
MSQAASALPFDLAVRDGVSRRSRQVELLLNCARIGFNP